MISEFLLDIVFGIVSGLLKMLPDITWNVETSAFAYIIDIIRVVAYMLPWGTVTTIVGLIIAFTIFKFWISVIRTIWDLLPIA